MIYSISIKWPDSPLVLIRGANTIQEVVELVKQYEADETCLQISIDKYVMSQEEMEDLDITGVS